MYLHILLYYIVKFWVQSLPPFLVCTIRVSTLKFAQSGSRPFGEQGSLLVSHGRHLLPAGRLSISRHVPSKTSANYPHRESEGQVAYNSYGKLTFPHRSAHVHKAARTGPPASARAPHAPQRRSQLARKLHRRNLCLQPIFLEIIRTRGAPLRATDVLPKLELRSQHGESE